MCGRTACTKSAGEIADCCSYQQQAGKINKPQWRNVGANSYNPSYNKGPKSYSPILLSSTNFPHGTNKDISERILLPMQWGLVPSWHKGDPKKFSFNMINCRSDTLTEKKSFMNALQKGQRCVVLAEGFYEWHTSENKKQPYYIQLKEGITPHHSTDDTTSKQLLTFAGIFDKHTSDEQGELYTYTIITVDASQSFKSLHRRMPAILETEEAVSKWLDIKNISWKQSLDLLVQTDCLEWYPVSTVVNKVRNNTEDCMKKIDISKDAAKKTGSGKVMSAWLKKGTTKRTPTDHDETSSSKKSKT